MITCYPRSEPGDGNRRELNKADGEKDMAPDKEGRSRRLFRKNRAEMTQTLWKVETAANLFVAKIMVVSGVFGLLFLILNWIGVFTNKNSVFTATMLLSITTVTIPAVVCLRLKGERTWLNEFLLFFYCLAFFGVEMLYGEHATLCLVIPVVISVRYYSADITAHCTIITFLLACIAEFLGVVNGFGRLDLNRVYLPAGTNLFFPEFMKLRDVVPVESIDRQHLWYEVLQHNMLPKMILLALVSLICVEIAKRGRKAILDQHAETKKTERLETELNLASQIQNDVLPNSFPAFPDRKEFTLYASMTPARKVGGDFYDFFFVDENHIALVIADVSDKGVGAALFMMVARTLIKTRTLTGGSPSEILADVNNQLCEGNNKDLFVTVWLGILDITTGKGIAANAGHEHPAIRRSGETFELVSYQHSFVLGAMKGIRYKEHDFYLKPGDSLFVYTDGVPEAKNNDDEQFGTDRMLKALDRSADSDPEEMIASVWNGIQEFIDGAEQFDDITMLCFTYNGMEK